MTAQIEQGETAAEEWRRLARREAVQFVASIAILVLLKVALDLQDENSSLRYRLRSLWKTAQRNVRKPNPAEVHLLAERGIDYTQLWLNKRWEQVQ